MWLRQTSRCHLSLPTMSQPYRKCALALYINSEGNDVHPFLEPANLCDTTIGNEFPECDASLENTSFECCILTQN